MNMFSQPYPFGKLGIQNTGLGRFDHRVAFGEMGRAMGGGGAVMAGQPGDEMNPQGAGPAQALYGRLYGRGGRVPPWKGRGMGRGEPPAMALNAPGAPLPRRPVGVPSPGGHPPVFGQQGPYGSHDPQGAAQSLRALFGLLQGGLGQEQVQHMEHGFTPGGFHGAFTGLSQAQLKAIGAMMALHAASGEQQQGQGDQPGQMGGYGVEGNLGHFLAQMMHAGGQRTGPFGGGGGPMQGPGGRMPPGRFPGGQTPPFPMPMPGRRPGLVPPNRGYPVRQPVMA